MKTNLLIALALAVLFPLAARAQDATPPVPPAPPTAPMPPGKPGKATITLDFDGRREVRVIDLDDAHRLLMGAGKSNVPKERLVWLGVIAEGASPELGSQLSLAAGTGLVVREVVAESPAEKAGLQRNDLLTQLDDQLLFNASQLRSLVQTKKEGDTVKLTYLRQGQPYTAEVKLAAHEVNKERDDSGEHHFWLDDGPGGGGRGMHFDFNDSGARDLLKESTGKLQSLGRGLLLNRRGNRVIEIDGGDDDSDEEASRTAGEVVEKELRKHGMDEKTVADIKKRVADEVKKFGDKDDEKEVGKPKTN